MKKSAFRHYNLSQAKRHQMTINVFGGADFRPQRFSLPDTHAIGSDNYVFRDGAIQKRHGLEQVLEFPTISYVPAKPLSPGQKLADEVHTNANSKRVNGMWTAVMEDGNEHTYAHVGKLLFEILGFGGELRAEPITKYTATVDGAVYPLIPEFEDYRSSAFYADRKLWFLGGNAYVAIRHQSNINGRYIYPVYGAELADIPTTTQSITAKNSTVSKRETYDRVNLLTPKRKNLIISGTQINAEAASNEASFGFIYQLDAPIIGEKQYDVLYDVKVKIRRRKR